MFAKIVHGEIDENYMEYPQVEEELNFVEKFLLFQGDIQKNPKDSRFVFVSAWCDYLRIVSMENDTLKEIKSLYSYFPKFRNDSNGSMKGVAILSDNPNGFISLSVTEDFIYALYSGRNYNHHKEKASFSDTIYVLDWEGNPVKKMILDKDAWSLYVDDTTNKLYTIHYNMTEEDMDIRFYAYDL